MVWWKAVVNLLAYQYQNGECWGLTCSSSSSLGLYSSDQRDCCFPKLLGGDNSLHLPNSLVKKLEGNWCKWPCWLAKWLKMIVGRSLCNINTSLAIFCADQAVLPIDCFPCRCFLLMVLRRWLVVLAKLSPLVMCNIVLFQAVGSRRSGSCWSLDWSGVVLDHTVAVEYRPLLDRL